MKILDILNNKWAIESNSLLQIITTYRQHLKSEKVDFNALLDKAGIKQPDGSIIDKNVAIIPIIGPVTKLKSFFSFYFGATSSQQISESLQDAADNKSIDTIILKMDTPGGTVDGAFELADLIADVTANSGKVVIAFTDGMIASAGYLFAASTSKIYITGKTNEIGSIGVIGTHIDESKWLEEYMGEKHTEIVSGIYKNALSPVKPLSAIGEKVLTEDVNYLHTLFVNDVSERRGIDVETLNNLQARLLIGEQALSAKLADGVATLEKLKEEYLSVGVTSLNFLNNSKGKKMSDDKILTASYLKAEHENIYSEVFEAGRKAGHSDGEKSGLTAERERIKSINSAIVPGYEALAEKAIDEGLSAGDFALQMAAQMKKNAELAGEKIRIGAEKPVEIVDEQPEPEVIEEKPEVEPTEEESMKSEWDKDKSLRAEFGNDFERFAAFKKADAKGQVKIKNN